MTSLPRERERERESTCHSMVVMATGSENEGLAVPLIKVEEKEIKDRAEVDQRAKLALSLWCPGLGGKQAAFPGTPCQLLIA